MCKEKKKKQECYCLKTNRTDVSNENNIIISESKHYKTNKNIHSRGWERKKPSSISGCSILKVKENFE